jgi:hypothetical protein
MRGSVDLGKGWHDPATGAIVPFHTVHGLPLALRPLLRLEVTTTSYLQTPAAALLGGGGSGSAAPGYNGATVPPLPPRVWLCVRSVSAQPGSGRSVLLPIDPRAWLCLGSSPSPSSPNAPANGIGGGGGRGAAGAGASGSAVGGGAIARTCKWVATPALELPTGLLNGLSSGLHSGRLVEPSGQTTQLLQHRGSTCCLVAPRADGGPMVEVSPTVKLTWHEKG